MSAGRGAKRRRGGLALVRPGPQPPEGDARDALEAFILAHYSEVHEVALAHGNKAAIPEYEQLAYLELWSLDPTRYTAADAPFLLEAIRARMGRRTNEYPFPPDESPSSKTRTRNEVVFKSKRWNPEPEESP